MALLSSMMAALLLPKMAPGSHLELNRNPLGDRQAIPKCLASLASHVTTTCLTFYIQLHQWTVNKHPRSSSSLSFEMCRSLNLRCLLGCLGQKKLTCKHGLCSSFHPVKPFENPIYSLTLTLMSLILLQFHQPQHNYDPTVFTDSVPCPYLKVHAKIFILALRQ